IVPPLAARPDKGANSKRIGSEELVGRTLIVVAVVLDQELDLLALSGRGVLHRGVKEPAHVGIGVVLNTRAEDDADHGNFRSLSLKLAPIPVAPSPWTD